MRAYVVDTNVAVVANGKSPQADIQCRLACVEALENVYNSRVCLDSGDRILAEYRNNLSMSGQPGVGDRFLLWVHQNQYNSNVCERVILSKHSVRGFNEFPDNPELAKFDPSDRKFVSVALASQYQPFILNAVDYHWLKFQKPLYSCGVRVKELCPQCIKMCKKT